MSRSGERQLEDENSGNLEAGGRVQELMGLHHPILSIKDIIWLLNHDSIIPREVLGGVGDLL
jgi:hypothetical protein